MRRVFVAVSIALLLAQFGIINVGIVSDEVAVSS